MFREEYKLSNVFQPPFTYYPFRFKYSPRHSVLKHRQSIFNDVHGELISDYTVLGAVITDL